MIDLAETCQMYDKHNYKAAGVCYNNIANLQFKNNKYMLAAENYQSAIELSQKCLEGFYSDRNDKFTLGLKERFYFLSV